MSASSRPCADCGVEIDYGSPALAAAVTLPLHPGCSVARCSACGLPYEAEEVRPQGPRAASAIPGLCVRCWSNHEPDWTWWECLPFYPEVGERVVLQDVEETGLTGYGIVVEGEDADGTVGVRFYGRDFEEETLGPVHRVFWDALERASS